MSLIKPKSSLQVGLVLCGITPTDFEVARSIAPTVITVLSEDALRHKVSTVVAAPLLSSRVA